MNLLNMELELKALLESEEFSLEQVELLNHLITQKTDNMVEFRRSLENHIELLSQYLSEIKLRKDRIEKKIEQIDDYVLTVMSINDRDEFVGNLTKIKKRKPSLSVDVYDRKLIPLEFIKTPPPEPYVMKAEILKLLKQGEVIQGARLQEGKPSLKYGLK